MRRLHVILISCCITFLIWPCAAAAPSDQMYTEFSEANTLFRQANAAQKDSEARRLYEQAILRYQRLIEQQGIHNGRLYYNLANAYLLKGDLGRAILNYRRAEQLMPADHNIQKNLAFARSRRIDKVQPQPRRQVLRTLFFWHYDFSIQLRFLLACLMFGLTFLCLTAWLWLPKSTPVKAATCIFVILFLSLAGSVALEQAQQSRQLHGVVVADSIIARQGDGDNYMPSFKEPLHAGTEVRVLEKRPGWLHVELLDGTDTWLPEKAVGLI